MVDPEKLASVLSELRPDDMRMINGKVFNVDIAEEAILKGLIDAWYYDDEEIITGRGYEYLIPLEAALVRGALKSDGPWWTMPE